jgi:phospholipid/cholesterol/gamma-HCH transport system substrate-binding protein
MTRRGLEIRVGAAVVIAGVILVVGTMWFQKFQLMEKRYHFYATFTEVGGLVSGDPIVIDGVEAGRVHAVRLAPGRVVAEMAVREGVELPVDSYISLKSIGIMGERFVAISQGQSGVFIAPGDSMAGTFLMGLSEVMGSMGDVINDIALTAKDLREVAQLLAAEGRLKETMDNLANTSSDLRSITAENRPRLNRAISRFEHAAAMMDSLVAGHYDQMDSSLTAVSRSGYRLEAAVANFDSASTDLKEITTALKNGEGTLGKLMSDDELIKRLESSIGGLDSLIMDIRMNPGRYVTFELF